MSDWEGFLGENPKVLWGLVADVVKAVKAGEGERKTGRRPAASCASLEELYDVLFPAAYATVPLQQACADMMRRKGMNQRALAAAIYVDQATVSRLLRGQAPLTIEVLEQIADALDVRPSYFAEYRAMKLGRLVSDVLLANPTLSAESIRGLFLGAPA